MFTLKKQKKVYQSPLTIVAEVDLEGLVCTSAFKAVQVDELRNKNAEKDAEGNTLEPFYFES